MAWVSSAVNLAKKWGPGLLAALKGLDEFNKRYPGAPGKTAEFARGLGGRLQTARARNTASGRVRYTLDIVRNGIDAMEQDRGDDLSFRARAAAWRREVVNLETAVSIADAQPGKRRRALLDSVAERTEALSEEIISETTATAEIMAESVGLEAADERVVKE